VYDQQGEIIRAENELKLAREAAPTVTEFSDRLRAHTWRREGERLFQAGFPDEALEILVEALRLDNEDALLHNDLGVVLHSLGERARARQSFERAMLLAPALIEPRENIKALS
jgi:Flp pilus assembly protein TadD